MRKLLSPFHTFNPPESTHTHMQAGDSSNIHWELQTFKCLNRHTHDVRVLAG